MPSTLHQLTERERSERRERDRHFAQQAVECLRSSDGWQQWLRTRAAFHTYSFGNQLLIAAQHPTATTVAGFRAWLKLGYCVRKGQKGVRIWAPCPPTARQLEAWQSNGRRPKSDHEPSSSSPRSSPRTRLRSSRHRHRLPRSNARSANSKATSSHGVLPSLIDLGGEIGSSVQFAAVGSGARGFYEPATKRIVIERDMAVNQQVATLCHELAHALVRAERDSDDPTFGYASEELIAESVAFTCIRSLGIDSDPKSIPYLASWAERADLTVIEHAASLIDRLARRIEAVLHAGGSTSLLGPRLSLSRIPSSFWPGCRASPRTLTAAAPLASRSLRSLPLACARFRSGAYAAAAVGHARHPDTKERTDAQQKPSSDAAPAHLPQGAGAAHRHDVRQPDHSRPGQPRDRPSQGNDADRLHIRRTRSRGRSPQAARGPTARLRHRGPRRRNQRLRLNRYLEPAMSALTTNPAGVGPLVELGRYSIPAGDRILYGQRVNGVVRVTDRPADGDGRSFLVERGLQKDGNAALQALIADYLEQAIVHQQVPMLRQLV